MAITAPAAAETEAHRRQQPLSTVRSGGVRYQLGLAALRLGVLAAILVTWHVASEVLDAAFWISRPADVGERLVDWIDTGFIWPHLRVTMYETALGIALGGGTGIVAGLAFGLLPRTARVLDPFMTAAYALPKIALAPLFVLWFGIGTDMKVYFSASIVFFFVFYNAYAGAADVDKDLVDIMRVMGAKRRHILNKLVLPGALASIFVGLTLAVPYGLVGAVVAEIISSNRGLGYLLSSSAGQFDTTGQFAALVVLMVISALMNAAVRWLERRFLGWKGAAG